MKQYGKFFDKHSVSIFFVRAFQVGVILTG